MDEIIKVFENSTSVITEFNLSFSKLCESVRQNNIGFLKIKETYYLQKINLSCGTIRWYWRCKYNKCIKMRSKLDALCFSELSTPNKHD